MLLLALSRLLTDSCCLTAVEWRAVPSEAGPHRHLPNRPTTGTAFLFEHSLLHSSTPVRSGRKYAMRTDVMYTEVEEEGALRRTQPTRLRRWGNSR